MGQTFTSTFNLLTDAMSKIYIVEDFIEDISFGLMHSDIVLFITIQRWHFREKLLL